MEREEVLLTLPNGFSGSYELLKFIITELNINSGSISSFAKSKGFTSHCAWKAWATYGVPIKIWNALYKDLIILNKAKMNQDFKSLEEFKEQYKQLNNNNG